MYVGRDDVKWREMKKKGYVHTVHGSNLGWLDLMCSIACRKQLGFVIKFQQVFGY